MGYKVIIVYYFIPWLLATYNAWDAPSSTAVVNIAPRRPKLSRAASRPLFHKQGMEIAKGSSGEGPMCYPRYIYIYISGCAIPFCVRYTVCIPHNTLQLNIAPQHRQYLCKRVFQALFVRVYVGGNGIPLLFPSTWWLLSLNPIT